MVTNLLGPEDGVELIHLELAYVDLTQEIVCKGLELIYGFTQPLQHRVGVDLEHPRCGPNAQAFSQTRQHAHDQLHSDLFAMKNRAMMLGKIAVARGAVKLTPGAATGMAIGPQVVQPQPAAIITSGVGTKVPGGVHRPGTAVRERHGIGPSRRRWRRLAGLVFTQHTVRLVRQALECCGLGRTLALGLEGRAWHRRRVLASPGPAEMQHDEEPDESQQGKLVVKKMRNHGVAPSKTG